MKRRKDNRSKEDSGQKRQEGRRQGREEKTKEVTRAPSSKVKMAGSKKNKSERAGKNLEGNRVWGHGLVGSTCCCRRTTW